MDNAASSVTAILLRFCPAAHLGYGRIQRSDLRFLTAKTRARFALARLLILTRLDGEPETPVLDLELSKQTTSAPVHRALEWADSVRHCCSEEPHLGLTRGPVRHPTSSPCCWRCCCGRAAGPPRSGSGHGFRYMLERCGLRIGFGRGDVFRLGDVPGGPLPSLSTR